MSTSVHFTILGEPASKANSRRIVQSGGKTRSIKSAKGIAYAEAFAMQCPRLKAPFESDVAVRITIFYASRRPDLDESIILDCMQGLIYRNDRQVKEKHIYWALDRKNPRAEIRVELLTN